MLSFNYCPRLTKNNKNKLKLGQNENTRTKNQRS